MKGFTRMALTPSLIERFWKYVERKGPGECWEWKASKTPKGYGMLNRHENGVDRKEYAHRLSYQIHYGEIPAGYEILHQCDTPSCCNPAHLRAGTSSENRQEAWDRGQQPRIQARSPKFTQTQYKEICDSTIPKATLLAKYNLTRSQLQYIRAKYKSLMPIDKLTVSMVELPRELKNRMHRSTIYRLRRKILEENQK